MNAYTAACEFCGKDLDIRAPGVYQQITGWAMNRAGGGAHGVSLPERSRRWAHRFCVERAVRGTIRQGSLLDEQQ